MVSGLPATSQGNTSQNPVKCANLWGEFDMAPINQYDVVCHIASNNPNMI